MRKISDTAITFLLFGAVLVLIIYSPLAKDGALRGIYLCEKIIIPSLLPVLIICNILSISKSAGVFEAVFGKAVYFLFHLPPCSAPAVILGLLGGFPAGAVLTNSLFKNGMLTSGDAKRIMRFNFSGGVAFIITALGEITYGSKRLGIMLYIIISFSEILVALLTRGKKRAYKISAYDYLRFDDALIVSVNTAVKSLAMMSAIIILFSAAFRILDFPPLFVPLFEITNGLCSKHMFSIPFLCFYLSFGGLCIHLQLFGLIKEMKISYLSFLLWRIASAVISFIISSIYLHFFPQSELVFNNISSAKGQAFTSSVSLSLVMIIGCAVIVFDIENRKLKKA